MSSSKSNSGGSNSSNSNVSSGDKLTRVAIVSAERCKPKKCGLECKKSCPVVRMGKVCIEVKHTDKISYISEVLCIGCGICVKKCPFGAINIINLPANLEKETTHRYSANSFKLHRLPTPRPGQVLGLVGTNGIGKSTALKILAGKQKPNLGRYENPPDWQEILTYFRGSELQSFFTRILEEDIRAIIKPQYVDNIPKMVKGTVAEILKSKDSGSQLESILRDMDLAHIAEREISQLSGGELQRFACAVTAIQTANIYMFDEPSSYLDVKQRLKTARLIRSLLSPKNYVVVVEHDLSVLDYLSDYICCLYGKPGIYGVVTMPFSVREGINIFLDGFVPTENLRFRENSLTFKVSESVSALKDFQVQVRRYNDMTCTKGAFSIAIDKGNFQSSEIIVLLGENGTGKTTFVKMLAGIQKPDNAVSSGLGSLSISYKPQTISPKFDSTVKNLFIVKIPDAFVDPKFVTDVIRQLGVERLLDQEVKNLSGGELQRIAICLALGKNADVYLIDEPSAYLDSEQRLLAAKVIKRFIIGNKKTAFIVEHDFIMATYMADKVIVFHGQPSIKATATKPESLLTGMNIFLKLLDITFRRDPSNYRPRINKHGSAKESEQKKAGAYFFFEASDD